LRWRQSTPDAYRRTRCHRSHRGHSRIGQAQARLTASGAEPWRTAGRCEPGTTTAVHGWRRGPRGSGAVGLRFAPATSRLDRGEGETVWSTGQTWRVSAHASGRPDADLMSGQGNRGRARAGRRAFGSPAGPRPCRQALPPGSTADAHHAAPAWPCPPAWWVGRGLATRPRAVTPGDPPADAPARGDQHPARIGVRQGPQMHLLADAWRRPSLHPADLRLALPGVPHPRPAVLQPRRPAVPGARHRADGGGAGPAVARPRGR
jgi:hypothetical protein